MDNNALVLAKIFKVIMITTLVLVSDTALFQKWECPLRQGKVKSFSSDKFSHHDPANGVIIQSFESDTVRSVVKGKVLKVLSYKSSFKGVLVKVNDTTFVSYFYLQQALCHEGDTIELNNTIGIASREDTGAYRLGVSIKSREAWLDPTPYFNCK